MKETHKLIITSAFVENMYARNFNYDIIKPIVIEVFFGPDQKLTGINRATMG